MKSNPLKDKFNIPPEKTQPRPRPSWDEYFLALADVVATRSHDGETQVGAILVDSFHRVVSTGYNGFPPGCDDENLPNLRPEKYPFMVHAEINALAGQAHAAPRQGLMTGTTLYCTHSPCRECAKALAAARVSRVVYREAYVGDDFDFVRDFFEHCGIEFGRICPPSPPCDTAP
jgi:dCMP deaminase